jgi:IS30 family transposase
MSYNHFTPHERYLIDNLLHFGLSHREIAGRLNRHYTSIGREVKRNGRICGPYWDKAAQEYADQRKHKFRHNLKRGNEQLYRYVTDKIRQEWSPEIIAGCLKRDYPEDETMRMSPEGIYRWVYKEAIMQGSLYTHLVRHHKKRRKQHKYGSGRGLIPDRISISERPEVVAERSRFGDWEGDTLEGAKGTGGLATHVERKSRYLITAKLSDKQAKTMTEKTIKAFAATPRHLRKTLTVDNGKEFAEFKRIQLKTGLAVYFADPYSAWQRGTNENTNGLLRRYFPKGTDFSKIKEKQIAFVAQKLNNRPRKCLSYLTPQEVFFEASCGALAT